MFKGGKTHHFHFASAAQLDEYSEDVANAFLASPAFLRIQSELHPKDNIQIQADLEDQVQERRNLEGDVLFLNSKWQHPTLPSTRIIGNCIIGIHLSN